MQGESRYAIDTEEYSVQLKKQYQKIITLLPAPNKTFVFLALLGVGSDALVHVDAAGTVLFEHKFTHPVDSIAMIASEEVVALEPRLNQITVFNLNSHSNYPIPFNFMNEETDQSSLYTFNKSHAICVVQNGRFNDNRLKLSYFKKPLQEKSKPSHVYETDCEWNYQYILKKGNEDSMIVWFKARHDQEFELKTYQLKQFNGIFNTYKTKNNTGTPYEHSGEIQLALINVWEVEPGNFCLVCNSEKTNLGLKNNSGCVNNNFIWDVKANSIRQANFWFDEKYNDYLIDIHSFGQFSIFRTYFFQNGEVEASPVYYVHNKSERIAATHQWECSYLVKFEYPGYDQLVVESQYENQDVKEFKVRVRRVVEPKQ